MATIGKYGKVEFSESDIQFINDNFQHMTNQQIADALGLKKTIVRMKAYELGLQRMKLEYWPPEAVEFLKANYQIMGNTEVVKNFNNNFPKQKGWSTHHIDKKLEQLGLKRTKDNLEGIIERNRQLKCFGKPNPKLDKKRVKTIIHFRDKKYVLKPGQTTKELYFEIISNEATEYINN